MLIRQDKALRVSGKHLVARRLHFEQGLLVGVFDDTGWARGPKVAKGLATQLEREHPSAAASLREGFDDMFTVRRLGASDRLARSLSRTTAIESMISTVRLVSSGVEPWHDPATVRRWVGTGMIEAQRSFRPTKSCKETKPLVDAVRAEAARRLAEEEGEVTSAKYDQAAA